MSKEQLEIKKDYDYAMRSQTPQERDLISSEDMPSYQIELNLSEDQKDKFTKQVFIEFDAIKKERDSLKLVEKWGTSDRQYDGELKDNKILAFNLHVQQSKIKVDAIVRAVSEAFLDSDPIVDVTPRPETARRDGYAVAEKQAQFIDYAMDEEIKPAAEFVKIVQSATKKFVGIGKLCWSYCKERRRREETYDGAELNVLGVQNGNVVTENVGLKRFLQAYPDALQRYPAYVKRLTEGKKINIVVEYKDTVKNNPELKYIKIEDFYVRNACKGNDGLKTEHLIAERQTYSYWELKKKERDGEFENVDELFKCNDNVLDNVGDYMTKTYDVLEVTTYLKLNDSDQEETKVKAWFAEEKQQYLGGIVYPYFGFDTDYLAFYLTVNDYGFYGDCRSVLHDLKDSNIAQDALLNLLLHGIYVRNILTPIVHEGSEIEQMFLDHQFQSGRPLVVDSLTDDVNKAVGFVQYPNMDTNSNLVMMEKLKRIDSDVTRVSDLTTGGESTIDPSAPASKTIALLQQSGIGIKDYIRNFLPTFNEFASNLLQLYYQMSLESEAKYKVVGKSKAVTGDNPFRGITREEMIVKTNVQARAASFAFDKMNEKREALAAYQTVMGDPYASRQPKLQYKALKVLLETFGERWKSISDTELSDPEEFAQEMQAVAMQAIQALFQQAQQQAQNTGVAPDSREVMAQAPDAVANAQAVAYNPALAEGQ